MDLAIITVSYNTKELLANCLESALSGLQHSNLSGKVWVVDNASSDGSADMVRQRFPQVNLIAHNENLGFGAGNNLALQAMRFGAKTSPGYILFLNPDTRILDDALGIMVRFLDATPDAGAAGAQLVHDDGSFQHSAFSFPGLAQIFLDFFPLHHRLLNSRLNGRYPRELYGRRQPFAVDHPLGAALMVRGHTLGQVGAFDEQYFMYCEEIDLCQRIRAANWEIYCVPQAEIVHLVGQSTAQFRDQMFVALWRSRFLMFKKHQSQSFRWAARRLVHLGLWAETRRVRSACHRGEITSGETGPAGGLSGGRNAVTVRVAAVVLTKNEEPHIGDCLDSLAWVDERVVFDDFSTDRTAEIARARGARLLQHPFHDFAAQRNAALVAVDAEWVFFVDADERATPDLAAEVRQVLQYEGEQARAGWWVPRHNFMIGHRMRGGGWYPDPQLRLLRRGRAHYDPAHPVHEVVILDGNAGHLRNVFIHYNYDSVAEFRRKMDRYADFEARILDEQNVRVRPWTYVSMPLREFWRRFVTLQGYRDHIFGLLFCGLMAWYTLVTYQRLRRFRAGEAMGAQSGR